jgi:hypothetical protein
VLLPIVNFAVPVPDDAVAVGNVIEETALLAALA